MYDGFQNISNCKNVPLYDLLEKSYESLAILLI